MKYYLAINQVIRARDATGNPLNLEEVVMQPEQLRTILQSFDHATLFLTQEKALNYLNACTRLPDKAKSVFADVKTFFGMTHTLEQTLPVIFKFEGPASDTLPGVYCPPAASLDAMFDVHTQDYVGYLLNQENKDKFTLLSIDDSLNNYVVDENERSTNTLSR